LEKDRRNFLKPRQSVAKAELNPLKGARSQDTKTSGGEGWGRRNKIRRILKSFKGKSEEERIESSGELRKGGGRRVVRSKNLLERYPMGGKKTEHGFLDGGFKGSRRKRRGCRVTATRKVLPGGGLRGEKGKGKCKSRYLQSHPQSSLSSVLCGLLKRSHQTMF